MLLSVGSAVRAATSVASASESAPRASCSFARSKYRRARRQRTKRGFQLLFERGWRTGRPWTWIAYGRWCLTTLRGRPLSRRSQGEYDDARHARQPEHESHARARRDNSPRRHDGLLREQEHSLIQMLPTRKWRRSEERRLIGEREQGFKVVAPRPGHEQRQLVDHFLSRRLDPGDQPPHRRMEPERGASASSTTTQAQSRRRTCHSS